MNGCYHTNVEAKSTAPARCAGFTVIELVTTIIIVGVISALAIPRMFDNQAFSERGYIDEVAFTLRYAQKIAIASECAVSVTIDAGSYAAMQRQRDAVINTCDPAGAWNVAVLRGDGSVLSGTAPVGIALAPAGPTVVTFAANGAVVAVPPQLSVGAFTLDVDASGAVTVQP